MTMYQHPENAARENVTQRRTRMSAGQRLRQMIQRWQRGRAMSALHALPGRYLAHIGLAPADIARTVEGFFAREAAGLVPVPVTRARARTAATRVFR